MTSSFFGTSGSTPLLLLAAGTALDSLGHRAVDVVVGDPALVIVLLSTSGGASRFRAGKGLDNLLLCLLGGLDAGLREQGLDPGLVDEVKGAAEKAGQNKIEEDAKT